MTVDELIRAVANGETVPEPGLFHWFVASHGFSPSWTIEVETTGTVRRHRFDLQMRRQLEWTATIDRDALAAFARSIAASGFPAIELPAGYRPRPDIGQLTLSVSVGAGGTQRQQVTLPQDAASPAMQAIGEAFATLMRRAGH